MLIKFLLSFTLFLSVVVEAKNNYPHTYEHLGTPLFISAQYFLKHKDIANLKVLIQEYSAEVNRIVLIGKKADKTKNKSEKKTYLKSLRKLQQLYDKLLHNLHISISKSIKADNYELFLQLTSYSFNGLFTHTNLRNEAIDFYAKYKDKKKVKCLVLEKNIANEKLSNETQELFAAEILHSSYDSEVQKKSNKNVSIMIKRVQNTIKVFLYNRNIYDVTIRVNYMVENISLTDKPPKEFVLKARSKYHYTTLKLDLGESKYSFSWSYTMGSKNAVHNDNYTYRLPYETGTSHVVSQGYNGEKTHKGSSAYAIDFAMPEGTKIYAARDGVVVKIKSNSDIGGYDKKYASSGNYVRILHNDGTFAIYYHLKYNGVIVKVGEIISKGKAIGYSGSTGYSSGPHLHFTVFKAISASKRETLVTKFKTADGMMENPIKGTSYKAI